MFQVWGGDRGHKGADSILLWGCSFVAFSNYCELSVDLVATVRFTFVDTVKNKYNNSALHSVFNLFTKTFNHKKKTKKKTVR